MRFMVDSHGVVHQECPDCRGDCCKPADTKPAERPASCPDDEHRDMWAILYADADVQPEVFSGAGAREAAEQRYRVAQMSWSCKLLATVAPSAPSERVAQITAHRCCTNEEHDPSNGKLAGTCVVCGLPWPCEIASAPRERPDWRKNEEGYGNKEYPVTPPEHERIGWVIEHFLGEHATAEQVEARLLASAPREPDLETKCRLLYEAALPGCWDFVADEKRDRFRSLVVSLLDTEYAAGIKVTHASLLPDQALWREMREAVQEMRNSLGAPYNTEHFRAVQRADDILARTAK